MELYHNDELTASCSFSNAAVVGSISAYVWKNKEAISHVHTTVYVRIWKFLKIHVCEFSYAKTWNSGSNFSD